MSAWVSAADLADLLDISPQAARKQLKKRFASKDRAIRELTGGRGGRSGTRYEVALKSLPRDLQDAFNGVSAVAVDASANIADASEPAPYVPRADGQTKRQLAIFNLIEPAVRYGTTPEERGAAIREIAARSTKSLRTIERYVAAFNEHGLDGLARKLPADAGKARVFVSRAFDAAYRAARHPPELLPGLSDVVDEALKGLWKGRAGNAGSTDLGQLAAFLLLERCEALGIDLPASAFTLGRARVAKWSDRKVVHLRNNDAKGFQDSLPRIARTWMPEPPMAIIVADVKHLDVMITRPDGSKTYPKLIGFMDGGVGRIFPYLVQCPQRRSITQELVNEAFCAMAMDPHWGFPNRLLLDNGSEFGGLDKITPALQILNRNAGREIIRAKPYNASSKPIEPMFARLDRYCFSAMRGYTGSDRMNKPTQNVGRDPETFAGTWEEFAAEVQGLIAYYHGRKVGGQWGNRSPHEIFQAKVNDGWRPVMPDPLALDSAFCDRQARRLGQHGIRINGVRYFHPELRSVTVGASLDVMIPWRKGEPPIAMLPEHGAVRLDPDYSFSATDISGAKESHRRQQAYRKTVATIAAEGPTIDPVPVKLRIAARQGAIAIPGRTQFLDQGASVHELAAARTLADRREEAAPDAAERRRAREDRITANLEKAQARGR